MRITNKARFTTFIVALMILSGVGGFYVGTSFASERVTPTVVEETPVVTQATPEVEEVEMIEFVELGNYTITAYCGCEICCGQWASVPVIGAGGVELAEGVHCASPLPLGTIVEIGDLGFFEVQDRTAKWIAEKYGDKVIDIYFENHEDAIKFGKRTMNVKKMVEVM